MVAKSGQICQQEDGGLGRGHCPLFGTHVCGWHPMNYIMTSVPLLQNVMPHIAMKRLILQWQQFATWRKHFQHDQHHLMSYC